VVIGATERPFGITWEAGDRILRPRSRWDLADQRSGWRTRAVDCRAARRTGGRAAVARRRRAAVYSTPRRGVVVGRRADRRAGAGFKRTHDRDRPRALRAVCADRSPGVRIELGDRREHRARVDGRPVRSPVPSAHGQAGAGVDRG
jgi:hypothetical protein